MTAHEGDTMGDLVEFTGEYYSKTKRAKAYSEELAVALAAHAKELGIDTNDAQFVYDFAWIVKFIEVMVDNDQGVVNRLSKMMENLKIQV